MCGGGGVTQASQTKTGTSQTHSYLYHHSSHPHLLVCEPAGDEVAAHHIHVTHARGVGSEGGDNLHRVRVMDVHLQGEITNTHTHTYTHTHALT